MGELQVGASRQTDSFQQDRRKKVPVVIPPGASGTRRKDYEL